MAPLLYQGLSSANIMCSSVKVFAPFWFFTIYIFFISCIYVALKRLCNFFLMISKITQVNTNCSFKWWFHLLKGKSCLNLPGPLWKKKYLPLNQIIGCATIGGNNCKQAFAITGSESFTSQWKNFDQLFWSSQSYLCLDLS